jgi:mono/diheme cytochrome c family protein
MRSLASARGRHVLSAGHRRAIGPVVLAATLLFGACAESPEVPAGPDGNPDPVLSVGRDVYGRSCASCHGSGGEGGRGKRLNNGQGLERYPDIADMIEVIAEGKGSGMPAFGAALSEDQQTAVARYILEVLN